jgi:hypothetical protein
MDQIVLIFLEGGNKKMEVYPLYWSSAWTRLFCRWWWNHIFSDYVPVYSRFWAPAPRYRASEVVCTLTHFSHSSRNCRLWLTIEGPCMKRRPYGKNTKCTASLAGCHAETFLFGRFHKRSPALVQSAPLEWTKHPISHAFVYWPSHAKAMRKKQMISSERKKRFRCVPRKSDARAEHNRRSRASQKWFYLFFVGPAWVSF